MRSFAVQLLDKAPPTLRDGLRSVAAYVGGKCMGYPAIWFLERMLGESPHAVVRRCSSTLCLSLSTSIVDDLADRDEPLENAHLAYIYMLAGEAAFGPRAAPEAASRLYRALDVCCDASARGTTAAAVRRGSRIGSFFAMIAADALDGSWTTARRDGAIEATGAFGEVCAHLDDWMDAERDLQRGALDNVTLLLLRERLEGADPTLPALALHGSWLHDRMLSLIITRLAEIDAALTYHDFGDASKSVRSISARLRQDSPALA